METRNIIAAISLSAAVIILYSLFFAPPPVTKENLAEKTKTEQNSDAPSLDQKENVTEISREEALQQSERIQFENQSIVGSISLKGAAIDDLTFKEYNVSLESDESKVALGRNRTPEFDDWRWVNYWYPVEQVIKFKRDVYFRVLTELENSLNNYLRQRQ